MGKKSTVAVVIVVVLMAFAVPVFAQSTTTLDISTSNITPNLFLGANIMITALLGVMMLIAGLSFGMSVLMRIVGAMTKGVRG